ncbi:hypothetical protein [Aquimarina litoralis]|uniref:hypothetical protein n=1 Tax=Aquimarina litoralis TaxID=584605 RepID=UPI001C575395|nr:hypothetical protein [Aquimarina litoralis]MBW1296194.1 hypothetical protein [Aquimarina litoralis]
MFAVNNNINFWLLLIFTFGKISSQDTYSLTDLANNKGPFIPNYSYAGYHFGEQSIEIPKSVVVLNALDFGVIPNDEKDDSKALQKVFEIAHEKQDPVLIQLPPGRIILSDIFYFERSNIILNGSGIGDQGTEVFCPRPLMYIKDPEDLKELREYLIRLSKVQREKENNISIPFSQYSWSGGVFWTRVPGTRVKSYLQKYDVAPKVLGTIATAYRGETSFKVLQNQRLKVGDVVEIQWFNKQGKKGKLIKELYGDQNLKIGAHHWNYPDLPLVRQQVKIVKITNDSIVIKSPLLLNIISEYEVRIVEWKHLEEVGIQNFKITFPFSNYIAHHVEQGYNGIYLTRVFNSWVKNVVVENADSGILTEAIANVTIEDIVTKGEKKAHYTVQMGGVHNVLVKNLSVYNDSLHPLSFDTFSTKSVYSNCEIFKNPILDQHSGVNHQNLFDNIKVHLDVLNDNSYPLFAGGGASYWKPSHGSYNTFWNIEINILNNSKEENVIKLNGMNDGPNARVIGVWGNNKIVINYDPVSYVKCVNKRMEKIPSLYQYQLAKRQHM